MAFWTVVQELLVTDLTELARLIVCRLFRVLCSWSMHMQPNADEYMDVVLSRSRSSGKNTATILLASVSALLREWPSDDELDLRRVSSGGRLLPNGDDLGLLRPPHGRGLRSTLFTRLFSSWCYGVHLDILIAWRLLFSSVVVFLVRPVIIMQPALNFLNRLLCAQPT